MTAPPASRIGLDVNRMGLTRDEPSTQTSASIFGELLATILSRNRVGKLPQDAVALVVPSAAVVTYLVTALYLGVPGRTVHRLMRRRRRLRRG